MDLSQALRQAPFYTYHQRTKHTLAGLMSSGHYLDWANQPDPFRRYAGTRQIDLPRQLTVSPLSYFEALEGLLSGQGIRPRQSLAIEPSRGDLNFVSHLLFYAMAISAWKQIPGTAHRWSLRVNPSSGNLHPTETHLLVAQLDHLEPGAYHYFVEEHVLEARARGSQAAAVWSSLSGSADCPPLVICLTSIFWREAWKYRDRAYRYCQHDMGHALAAIMLSAAALGWRAQTFGEFPDKELGEALALVGGDEQPCLVIGLRPGLDSVALAAPGPGPGSWEAGGELFFGTANRLSREIVRYASIESVYAATCLSLDEWQSRRKTSLPRSGGRPAAIAACGAETEAPYMPSLLRRHDNVHAVVRRRRSAIDLDGRQRMTASELGTILTAATRGFRADFQMPTVWDPDPGPDQQGHHLIHLYIYAHRIDGLTPGIYYFDRFKQSLVPLVYADEREAAKFASCIQDIAADGCFAISMIADFNLAYALYADRGYRYVHYEAGVIGQWLYLGCTALGYDATGIGCFIDDVVNGLLGLPPGFEVVYNFTVGRAVIDPRLTTLPSYDFPDPTLQSLP